MDAKKRIRNTRRYQRTFAPGKASLQARMGTKRVSLYPGFLMNQVASSTMKKSKGSNSPRKPEENFLTNTQQAFLDRNCIYSRRIIINRHPTVEENNLRISKSVGSAPSLGGLFPKSPKPILEKNSKSIFKKIDDKYFKTHNTFSETPVGPETANNNNNNTGNHNTEQEDYNNVEIEIDSSPQLVQPIFSHNHLKTFTSQMRVSFKSDYFPKKSFENVAAEILKLNLIVEGRLPKEEISVEDKANEYPNSEEDIEDNFVPVPSGKWLYKTPKNQKIKKRKVKKCQLEPALLLNDKTVKTIKPILNRDGAYNKGFAGKVPEQRKTIKPILNRDGAYNKGFVRKMPEQRPSDMGLFEKELPFVRSELDLRKINPMEADAYFESPALGEKDITFVAEGHNLEAKLRLPNDNYKRPESYRDDFEGEKNMFDFHSQPKQMFDF